MRHFDKRKFMLIVEKDEASFYKRLADIFLDTAVSSVNERDSFHVALSGGSTPRRLHRLLTVPPYVDNIPWKKTKIFWVDERWVPVDHPESNFGNAWLDFLEKIPLPAGNAFPMKAELSPGEGAAAYELTLNRELGSTEEKPPFFDLILLGMGEDGHVASLFPDMGPDNTEGKWVISVKGGNPDVHRLTLTYPVLNQGRTVILMILGIAKAAMVKRVMENKEQCLPARLIKPKEGKLIWVLDQRAASLLSPVKPEDTSDE